MYAGDNTKYNGYESIMEELYLKVRKNGSVYAYPELKNIIEYPDLDEIYGRDEQN